MSVRLAEPPSEVGTGGGQTVLDEEWLEAEAVDVADCVEALGDSPGSCKGTSEVFDDEALMLDVSVRPVPPPALDAPGPPERPDGNGCVGTLSGSELVPAVDADTV